MCEWLVHEIIENTQKSIAGKSINFSPQRLLMYPESALVSALVEVEKVPEQGKLMSSIINFLINCRRYHFAYVESGELWEFMQMHLNQDFNNSSQIPGPFGMFVETKGSIPGLTYSVVPISRNDTKDNSNPYGRLFAGFLNNAECHFMNVVYISSLDSKTYNFDFIFPISQFFISDSQKEVLNAHVEVVDLYFGLRNKLARELTNEEQLLKGYLLKPIIESPVDWFEHSFQKITNKYQSEFDFDTFEFIKNMKILHSSLNSRKEELIKETAGHDETYKLMMVDFAPTRQNHPPEMRWLSSDDLVMLNAQNPENDLWPAANTFNDTIDDGQIGLWYSDSEFTARYRGKFSFYLKI